MKVCLECKNGFKENYKKQKFCSLSCNASYHNKNRKVSKETKLKISKSVKKYCNENKKFYDYICPKCGKDFKVSVKIKEGRPTHCSSCKRKTNKVDIKNISTLKEVSKRTITKIFKRMGLSCSVCGWKECVCDLHHIVSKRAGGSDFHYNLTYLCPNCHRMAHNGKIKHFISLEDQIKDFWKDFYFG